ncbi:MAG TPA: hypothetical protein PLJ47_10015, partial [Candidatus Hydrogenedentes bacterium]|nr:hypothetical protein [Candidatus Hydrogenedentota bacterium]
GFLKQNRWRDWVDENFEQQSTQELPGLSAAQINDFIDQGLRSFYLRPGQMWRMMRNIQNMADLKAKLHGVRSFVTYFGNKERAYVGFVGNN